MSQRPEQTGLLGETYQIEDLIKAKAASWNMAATELNLRIDRYQQAEARKYILRAEWREASEALTALVAPYTFSKLRSRYFKDDGDTFHAKMSVEAIGNRRTGIGSVDVWAAARVDPEFAKLVRQNIKVLDAIKRTDRAADFDAYDPYDVKSSAPGEGFEVLLRDKLFDPGTPEMAVRARLGRNLKKQFEVLIRDSAKGPRIEQMRDAFVAKFMEAKSAYLSDTYTSPDGTSPSPGTAAQMRDEAEPLYALAYLKQEGVTQIVVPPGYTANRVAYAQAIDISRAKCPFTVPVNDRAPDRLNPEVVPALKTILEKSGLVALHENPDVFYQHIERPPSPDRNRLIKKFLSELPKASGPKG